MTVSMEYRHLIETMSPQIYQRLVSAVELGRWADGKALTPEQRANAMQAIIAWGERHLPEQDRVGYVAKKEKADTACDPSTETPLNWKE
jgi:uncharacterized protein YeaC (DUF1315 family)